MVRSLLVCLIVATLSYWIQGIELTRCVSGQRAVSKRGQFTRFIAKVESAKVKSNSQVRVFDWVRTRDGWERSTVLKPQPQRAFAFHPLVVAGLQLMMSLFVLLAFPVSASCASGTSKPLVDSMHS